MADIFRVVTGTAPNSGTQDYTHADITNITAAVIMVCSSGLDSDDDHFGHQIGFWDGTDGTCLGARCPDASVGGGGIACGSNTTDGEVVDITPDATNQRTATCAAASGNDGITLTWNTNSNEPLNVTVLLIQLSSGNAKCGMQDKSATVSQAVTVTTTGVTPNCVLFTHCATATADIDNGFPTAQISYGIAVDNGASIDENVALFRMQTISTNLESRSGLYTGYCGAWFGASGGGLAGAISCTDMSAGSFDVTNDIGTTAQAFGYLALELEDVPKTAVVTSPTDGAEWDPYTDTLKRDAVLMFVVPAAAADTEYTSGAGTEGIGHYVVDSTGTEQGAFAYHEDGLGTSNTSGRHSSALIIQDAQGTPDLTASAPTFDDSGLVFAAANVSTATSAHQILLVGLGQFVESGVTLTDVIAVNDGSPIQ